MANSKPIGVAYADPALVSGTTLASPVITAPTITGGTIVGTPISGSTVSGSAGYSTTATTGAVASNATGGFYFLSTAITANSTATTAPVGSVGVTGHATDAGKLFVSDGSLWQYGAVS